MNEYKGSELEPSRSGLPVDRSAPYQPPPHHPTTPPLHAVTRLPTDLIVILITFLSQTPRWLPGVPIKRNNTRVQSRYSKQRYRSP